MLLFVAALVAGPITEAEVAAGLAQVPAIRDELDRELFDYPTARFRDVYVTVNGSIEGPRRGSYLCGLVNSKSRAGGYVGWTRFVAADGLVEIREGDRETILLDAMCGPDDPRDAIDRSALLTPR